MQLTEGQYSTDKKLACCEFQNTNTERLTRVKAVVHDAIAYYKLTYNDRKTHTVHTSLAKFCETAGRQIQAQKGISIYICRT